MPRRTDAHQPTPDDIEECFVALVEGRLTRDEADRWAARWTAHDALDWDDVSWWALGLLHGIDLPADESGAYLHDDEQLRAWLAELRSRRAV
ncbi:hypothetical protein ACF065_22915 [Streptomyces sp. NPDC015232]|uniref:hypothetical protein n=1 Tax=unclassified Streptomyces TaxID=2593676 RepID=UPI0036FF61FA